MDLARKVGEKSTPGDIICLKGELGAGKTHFVKGFVEAFGISPDVCIEPYIFNYPGVSWIAPGLSF